MTSPVRHIDIGRRKALLVKFEALRALRPSVARDEVADRRRKDLLQDICARADGLWDDDRGLDESLQDLGKALPKLTEKWSGTELQVAWLALVNRLQSFKCMECAGELACIGDERDHTVVAKHGQCLAPLLDLLAKLFELSKSLHSGLDAPSPNVMFATMRTGENNDAGMLDEFFIAGWHQVDGPATSVVGLEFRDRHFNAKSMAALLYTLVHELVCHAFQQVGVADREDCLPTCSWSEGWMDRFAIELAEVWLETRAEALPNWIGEQAETVRQISRDVHSRRYKPQRGLSEWEVDRRSDASVAYQRLRKAWSRNGELENNAVAAFTIALNGTQMSPKRRKQLGLDLGMLLSRAGSPMFNETVGLCHRFAQRDLPFSEFAARISEFARGA